MGAYFARDDSEEVLVTVEIVVALISATIAIVSLTVTVITQRQKTVLEDELEEARTLRSEERSRKQLAEEIVAKYREPLLLAAFDLQSRVYNIVDPDHRFLSSYYDDAPETVESYARDSTLFVVAQFFGWMEIIRRDVQFLDLGAEEQTRRLTGLLSEVQSTFRSDTPTLPDPFRVFSMHQRAIGELMVVEAGNSERECLGYAAFVGKLRDPEFARWFGGLRSDVAKLASGGDATRLAFIQNHLIDILDHLDPSHGRFTTHRDKLSLPDEFLI